MKLRWGIVGCGRIADDFVSALSLLPSDEHEVVAVAAASSLERAQGFVDKVRLPSAKAFGSYGQLFQCEDVDIVYIANQNHQHKSGVLNALGNGKHVLCEKPMGVNRREVEEMVALAKQKKLFLMEGYWSRFFPVYQKLKEELAAGVIGEPRILNANFGFDLDPTKLSLEFGGGALTAVGCYLPMFACFLFPQPLERVSAAGFLCQTGVDDTASITLVFSGNRIANLFYSGSANFLNQAHIAGSNGKSITLPSYFWCPTELSTPSGTQHFPLPADDASSHFPHSPGFVYEAQCIRQCLMKDLTECPDMTLEDSIRIVSIMDECRRQLGVRFPQDE